MTSINFKYDAGHFTGFERPIPLNERNLYIMKLLQLQVSTLILRFYLVMAIVIGAGFIGQWWLAILALPVFYSALMGIKFSKAIPQKKSQRTRKHVLQHS
jgi:hypothetical protein